MLQRLRPTRARRLRHVTPRPPVIPERRPATFLIDVPRERDAVEVGSEVESLRAALAGAADARLALCAVDADAATALRDVVSAAPAGAPRVDVLVAGDPVLVGLREQAIDGRGLTPGGLRSAYLRHRELDELLARAPQLYDALSEAAEGHPRAGEVGPLLEAVIDGHAGYARSGRTPPAANQAMRELSVITDGALNRAMLEIHGVVHPPYAIETPRHGILAAAREEIETALQRIDADGYYVFQTPVPEPVLDELEAFARQTPLLPQPGPEATEVLYDEASPVAPAYYLQPERALSSPVTRRLWTDASLLDLAQKVLGCQPVLSHFGMWWSTTASRKAVSEIAQLYHIDMDKLAFIQFFVYLTDVGPDNGPHTFVRGSHRHKPIPVRRDGRIGDRDIERHFPAPDILEICGRRGTVFAVDTSAFHKGKPVTADHRLVVQWVYASSLFGSSDTAVPVDGPVEPEFWEAVRRYPRVFERVTSPERDQAAH